MRPLLIALQFLTRLPVRLNGPYRDEEMGRSLLWYPAVGLVIGAMLAALAWLLADRGGMVPAALVLALWVALTGALHLDGLADSADAWAGGFDDRERSLAIMKDPHSGPVAVTLLVTVLLMKFAAVDRLLATGDWAGLGLAPVLGRSAVLALLLTTPYVRAGGLGENLVKQMPRRAVLAVLLAVAGLSILATQQRGAIALATASIGFVLLRQLMLERLGGTTGDTAGALVELTECVVLVTLALV
jgi:adenosylcobinamide-GDP ribazoletransferase